MCETWAPLTLCAQSSWLVKRILFLPGSKETPKWNMIIMYGWEASFLGCQMLLYINSGRGCCHCIPLQSFCIKLTRTVTKAVKQYIKPCCCFCCYCDATQTIQIFRVNSSMHQQRKSWKNCLPHPSNHQKFSTVKLKVHFSKPICS